MKKMRKLLSCILAFSMCISLVSQPVAAVEESSTEQMVEENNSSSVEIDPSELSWEEMYAQALEQLPSDETKLIEKGLMKESDRTNPNSRASKVYGPFTTMDISAAAAMIMVSGLKESGFEREVYENVACYKFTYNGDVTYVAISAIMPNRSISGQSLSNAELSSGVTDYMNDENTNHYYALKYDITVSGGIHQHKLAVYGVQAGSDGTSHAVVEVRLFDGVSCTRNLSTVSETVYYAHKAYPSIKLEITDANANNIYMNSCVIQGKGTSNTTTNLENLLTIGSAAIMIGTANFTELVFTDYYSLTSTLLSLSPNGGEAFLSDIAHLSNPSEGRYDYSCEMESTFKLSSPNHYYEMKIGINGNYYNCEYEVTVEI